MRAELMRLHSCRIENFRALRKVEISLDDTAIMIGENGCGKSSLLKAIEVCLGRGAPVGSFALTARDFHRPGFGLPQQESMLLELRFREQPGQPDRWPRLRQACLTDKHGRLDFKLRVRARRGEAGSHPQIDFRIEGVAGPCSDPEGTLAELRRIMPFLNIRSALVRRKPEPGLSADERARREVELYVRAALVEMVDEEELSPETLNLVYKTVEGLVERFEGRRAALPADSESLVMAPMSPSGSWEQVAALLKGSGARSLAMLAFVGAFLRARGEQALEPDVYPLVAIEEPEANLHPLMVTSVWDMVQRLPAQKLITTNSADLLAATPLDALRRFVRDGQGRVRVYAVPSSEMSLEDLRRVAYHLRVRRGAALFMRFWILVEGESEFWLLSEAARALDIDLRQEGIECVEFAQSGLTPLIRLANQLKIGWHLLADGDRAGQHYGQQAWPLTNPEQGGVTVLREKDLEQCLWHHGYSEIYRQAAGITGRSRRDKPQDVIAVAVKMLSKPRLALMLGEAMRAPGSPGVPEPLEAIVREAVAWSRAHGP